MHGDFLLQPVAQRSEPLHLVFELVAAGRLPVDEVAVHDAQRAGRGVDRGADDARMLVGEAADVLRHIAQRQAAQERDAVVGFLAEHGRFITSCLEDFRRELVVGHLELLQAQDIDRIGGEPVEDMLEAGGEGVDVPGGNFHEYPNCLF